MTPNATTGTVQSPVTRAEAYVDVATAGAPGSGIPMEAADGAYSTATENVYLDIPLATVKLMSNGSHSIWVRGRDAAGNWGAPVETVLVVDKTGPVDRPLTVTPNPTGGAPRRAHRNHRRRRAGIATRASGWSAATRVSGTAHRSAVPRTAPSGR